jgi:hypothetical protein
MTTGALERIVRQARTRPDGARRERCELCSLPVAQAHRHMLDVEGGTLLCVCRACSVLFNRGEAGQGRYRLIPERRLRVDGVSPADLGVPVGLAYFVVRPDGTVDAHYPRPCSSTPHGAAARPGWCPSTTAIAWSAWCGGTGAGSTAATPFGPRSTHSSRT